MTRFVVFAQGPRHRRLGEALRRRWPQARVSTTTSPQHLLHDAAEQCPDLIVLAAEASADLVPLCRQVRQLTSAPVLVVGPWDVTGHLNAGADVCVPSTSSLRLAQAYATSLLHRWQRQGAGSSYLGSSALALLDLQWDLPPSA